MRYWRNIYFPELIVEGEIKDFGIYGVSIRVGGKWPGTVGHLDYWRIESFEEIDEQTVAVVGKSSG